MSKDQVFKKMMIGNKLITVAEPDCISTQFIFSSSWAHR